MADAYASYKQQGLLPANYKGPTGKAFQRPIKNQLNQQNSDVNQPYQQYLAQAQAALPKLYAPAYQAISQQFQPQFAAARNMLGANPAVANSGVANRLNSELLRSAYGQLGQAMTGATGQVAGGGLDLLSQLIQQRIQARQREREKKQGGGIGGGLGGLVGGIGGAFGGPLLSAAGSNVGSKLFK